MKVDFTEDIKRIIKGIFEKYSAEFYDPDKELSEQPKWVRKYLEENPHKFKDYNSRRALIRQFLNLHKSVVNPVPRKVYLSSKVASLMKSSSNKMKLKKIKDELSKGIDINRYLSKGIFYVYKEDLLLTTWGIHHLHLSSKRTKHHYFMDRSDELLMAYFEGNSVYLLDVRKHVEKNEDDVNLVWTRSEVFELLAKEFPEVMSKYALNGVLPGEKISDADLKRLRDAGISTIMSVDGAAYIGPGGGIATSGCSMEITQGLFQYTDMFKKWENYLEENHGSLLEEVKSQGVNLSNLEFELSYNEQGFYVLEKNTKAIIPGLSQSDFFKRE
jgi:hypothetical protein